jgi:hypothetical protein
LCAAWGDWHGLQASVGAWQLLGKCDKQNPLLLLLIVLLLYPQLLLLLVRNFGGNTLQLCGRPLPMLASLTVPLTIRRTSTHHAVRHLVHTTTMVHSPRFV